MDTNQPKENWALWFKEHGHQRGAWLPDPEIWYTCPCCGLPTLTMRSANEHCMVCEWIDDGQDNHDAAEVKRQKNSNYSLKEARRNFQLYLTKFRPSDTHRFAQTTKRNEIKLRIIRKMTPYRFNGRVYLHSKVMESFVRDLESLQL